jgi:5-methylcytosine-specific restriction enzyme subunit McrC
VPITEIKKFEWETLCIGESGFKESHYKSLIQWQEKQGKPFFEVLHRKLRFKQWVGVIQVDGISIEILPKVDKCSQSENERNQSLEKWQKLLPEMIRKVKKLPLRITEKQDLKLRNRSLLDLYYEAFLYETEKLIHQGLVKKYRYSTQNRNALKGRLEINTHIQKNIVHREKFYTTAQVYDQNNIWNQILLQALRATSRICPGALLKAKANNLSLYFDDWPDRVFTSVDFEKLSYDRKTQGYQNAVELAKLILLQYNPNMESGKENVIAFLFDMNRLWEGWVEYKLKQKYSHEPLVNVFGQRSKQFWKAKGLSKTIRPDIVIEDERNGLTTPEKCRTLILDAKWKIPDQSNPSDADLKQMFIYNLYWNCNHSILVYPMPEYGMDNVEGEYRKNKCFGGNHLPGGCSMQFWDVEMKHGDCLTSAFFHDK